MAAVPFAFALIRLLETGEDVRYLWMATASTVCAAAFLVRSGSRVGLTRLRTGVAMIAATACAATVGIVHGATAVVGIAIVSVAFGFASAVGTWLIVRRQVPKLG